MTHDIGSVQSPVESVEALPSTVEESLGSIPSSGGAAVPKGNPPIVIDAVAGSLFSELSPTAADAQYLTALGVDANCRALRTVTTFFGTVAKDHATSLAVGHTPAWLDVATGRQSAVKSIFADDSRAEACALLGAALSHDAFEAPFSNLLFAARFQSNSVHRAMLDRMSLVLVLKAAQCRTVIPKTVANGIQQCYRSLASAKTTAWSAIATCAPIDIAQIDSLLTDVKQNSVREFLVDCRALLAVEFSAPDTESRSRQEHSSSQPPQHERASIADNDAPDRAAAEPKAPESSSDDDESEACASAPSVVAFAREAQFAPLSTKAGVALQWNCLATPELKRLIEEVTPYLYSSNLRQVSCAVLFYISLLTKANGKSARRTATKLDPKAPDLAISIGQGGLLTSHDAKVQARRPDHVVSQHRINVVYWPQRIVDILQDWESTWGEKSEIGEYIDLNAGGAGLSNAEYNKFLRRCGDKAHIAEPTRAANGLGLAVLDVTGSDMYASLGALHVEMAAPSADFYFSPLASEVHRQMDRVYQEIGLGPAIPFPEEARGTRLGPQKWVPPETTRDGWSRLEADIRRLYKRVCRWKNTLDGGSALDALSRSCCAALVVRDAGRGTNPQRLSVASLASNPSWYVLDDKFLEGVKRARLLPHTDVSAALVRIFLHAKSIAYKRMGWKEDATLDPLFGMTAAGRNFGLRSDWIPIDADAIQGITTEYFAADRNFARNQLVTSMGENLVDRWLVRALTGHGTWLLTSFSWTMSVAPDEAMGHLQRILTEHADRMFGDATALVALSKSIPPYKLPDFPLDIRNDPEGEGAGDPLPSIGRQCLVDHSLVASVRRQVTQGRGPACRYATTLLARLAVDGLPTLDAAIDATLDQDALRTVGATEGAAWTRRHYVHAFWLPTQAQTQAIATLATQASAPTRRRLLREAADFLRGISGYSGWPADDLSVLVRFATACERWRRLELPPSICAMSSPELESACLSPTSLERTATNGVFPPKRKFKSVRGPVAATRVPAQIASHNLDEITSLLGEWCTTDDSLGGQERRARRIKLGLADLASPDRTAIFLFCSDMLNLQADEVIANPRNAHVSTVKTRWSTVHPTFGSLPLSADPADFEDDEWVGVVDAVNKYCLDAARKAGTTDDSYLIGEGKIRSSRARDALQRMFRILEGDAWEIPQAAWDEMGGATLFQPRLSASSSIYLTEYAQPIKEEIYATFSHALAAERQDVKVQVMSEAPCRIGEVSCAASRCVTRSGAMTFLNTPYVVHKSKHAPRQAPLTPATASAVKALEERTVSICPDAQRLFRFDAVAQMQDVTANALLPDVLRNAIGDPEFRPQSLRGTAYMESLWPGFRPVMQRLLNGTLTPQECIPWLHGEPMQDRWIRAISAATAAGHGAVDPGYKFYASAWPLLLAIWMKAKSLDLKPADATFKAFGRTAANFRQIKCRSEDKEVDAWQWLPSAMVRSQSRPLLESVLPSQELPRPPTTRPADSTPSQTIGYIVLRCLELMPDAALHETGLTTAQQKVAEENIPRSRDIEWARKRKKGPITGAALDGDRSLALDPSGIGITEWLSGLSTKDLHDLFAILRRNQKDLSLSPEEIQECEFWRRVSLHIPSKFCLTLRFGQGHHLSPASELRLRELRPRVMVQDERDPNLGPLPDVMLRHLPENDRLDCRSTAIFKLACLVLSRASTSLLSESAANAKRPAGESDTSATSTEFKEIKDA
ncbi:hypothetical protein [Scleromatobacter humisilvae]|uniref:Uncharacterized protein n=1 Tax=Scleromatobacter humisilvae TaxID=2897159 RepID=A0A9X2C1C9_9BURK|nr:hypothetical protein [Scleromatobacter humisilvae]MCK9685639.1 hypothetical protein [Scleromatobacter humisilvae]